VVNIQSKAMISSLALNAHMAARSTAKVWIDAESLQVVRLQKPTAKSLWFQGPFAKTNGEYLVPQLLSMPCNHQRRKVLAACREEG